MSRRRLLVLLGVAGLLAALAPSTFRSWWHMLYRQGWVGARTGSGSVIFVVLDNVRADHTSLCGYSRPTTPWLERLAAGGKHTCRAYAPGTWTLPSHASYFTGVPMLTHGAHDLPAVEAGTAPSAPGTTIPMRALDGALPTLAERLAGKGYQTAILSANPVVGTASGLMRGFSVGLVAPAFGVLVEDRAVEGLRTLLREEVDPSGGPLFLFVNLAEAHQPWAAVPEGVAWLKPQPTVTYTAGAADRIWERYYAGALSESERTAFLANLTDVYDYGIWRADRSLGRVLEALESSGWCGEDCRVVVTSDHGELLGEHGLIDHGFYPWEGNARVPLVVAGPGAPALPEPFAGEGVFELVASGSPADGAAAPAQAAFGHPTRAANSGGAYYAQRMVAYWEGTQKWVWQGPLLARFDLAADPEELDPLPVEPVPAGFSSLRTAVEGFAAPHSADAELREQLEAAGYLEPVAPR